MKVSRPDPAQLQRILTRGVADIIVREEFLRLLESGRPLRLKQGFDPSAPDIHLGHVVGLRKLRQLQDLGHQVVLIVGDWTAQIGDPSGKSATRPMLTAEEVAAHAETYLSQFFKIVDADKTEVRRQTEWFDGFGLTDIIGLTQKFTVAQLLRRDDFAKRYEANQPIAITELLYPLLQAYDSVMIEADVEFGGTDQRFNNLLGRELQTMSGQRPQQVFLVPLLVGTDGVQKMGKSLGNYIGITDAPADIFGKTMSIPDELIATYFELLTDAADEDVEQMRRDTASHAANPMDLKKRLAADLVAQFYGGQAASQAQAHFEQVVQRKERPQDVPEFPVPFSRPDGDLVLGTDALGLPQVNIVRALAAVGFASSHGEARRLLQQGAVRIDGAKISADDRVLPLSPGATLQVGNRRFVRLVDASS